MELRTVLLSLLPFAALHAGPVQRYPLDDRRVYAVHVGTGAPTTVMFPGPISALDAAGISGKSEDEPPVLLSHQEGARFFSVRALKSGAVAAANVIYQNRVYAFAFSGDGEADRTVTFYEPTGTDGTAVRRSPERLLGLLDLVRDFDAITAEYPAFAQRAEQLSPGTETTVGQLTTFIEQVFRFPEEDTLVFRIRIENRGDKNLRYAPEHLGVRLGDLTFPVALTDASGLLPAGHAARIFLAITNNPDGSPAHLSLKNTFAVAMPPASPE